MIEIDFLAGETIDTAIEKLKKISEEKNDICSAKFNGKVLYSTDTVDDAYLKVIGKTKAEFDKSVKEWQENYERELAEHKARIPQLVEEYKEKAKGLILEGTEDEWNRIAPIRLGDLYRGMELQQTLDICQIMRDEEVPYNERLKKAYDLFMESGHSGNSACLMASMLRKFCPYGYDIADAVMNFRFKEKKEESR